MKRTLLLFVVAAQLTSCGLFKREDSSTEAAKSSPDGAKPPSEGPKAVPHEALAATLPREIQGWKTEALPGAFIENGGNQLSRASANYSLASEGQPGFFNIEVVDGTHVPAVQASLAILVHAVDDVHRMNVEVSGYQAIQQWIPESNSVTSTVVVGNRFVVTLKGTNVPPEVVSKALNSVDARQLESLAGVTNGPAARALVPAPTATSSGVPSSQSGQTTAPSGTSGSPPTR